MERLTFGRRAARRRRLKRLKRLAAAVSLLSMAAGIPGVTFATDLLQRVAQRRPTRVELRGIEATESAASMLRFRRKVFDTRPVLKPSPEAEVETTPDTEEAEQDYENGGSIVDIIYSAAAEFGLDGDYLLAVAECESGLDPGAVSAGGYYGLFQFDQTTWVSYGYASIYDPVAQARTAARLLAAGQAGRWPNCA